MNPGHAGLFDLAQQRLAWTARRQSVLAQNIANAATPGFVPKDVPSFAKALGQTMAAPVLRTQPNHLAGTTGTDLLSAVTDRPKARSPDGNAVSLDEQLTKVADTESAQALVTSIYRKYLTLFSLALGRTQ